MMMKGNNKETVLLPLAVSLGNIVTTVDNQVLVLVVEPAGEVTVENLLGTLGIADLSIDRGSGHVRSHGVTTTHGAGHVTQRVVLGGRLGEPHITTVATELTRLDSVGHVFLDHDSTTGRVDQPSACFTISTHTHIQQP